MRRRRRRRMACVARRSCNASSTCDSFARELREKEVLEGSYVYDETAFLTIADSEPSGCFLKRGGWNETTLLERSRYYGTYIISCV